jgi:hypothetical protein
MMCFLVSLSGLEEFNKSIYSFLEEIPEGIVLWKQRETLWAQWFE